jgi:23S rRNA pseudouridine2605 synthase
MQVAASKFFVGPLLSENLDRLHKRIAASGLCSRRAAETLIADGRVMVNGEIVREQGVKVGDEDTVLVDGAPLPDQRLLYLLMNKPKGVLTTLRDPHGRRTVKDLLPDLSGTVKPVGRLDKDTEGLLIFTNDGALAQRLTHPRYGIEKEYIVQVKGIVADKDIQRLAKGMWIPEGGKTAPATVNRIQRDEKADRTTFNITIHEGRKRQIRLMCMGIGHPVKELKRVRVGPIELKSQPRGTCRMLGKPEIEALRAAVQLSN